MDVDECSNYTTHFRYNKDKETINKLFDSGFGTLVWESFNNIALYKTIYFAPVGVMGEIGIENLPFCSDPIGFIKKTHRLTSTSIIPVLKENSKNNLSTANLFGGLYYGNSFTAFDRGASHSGYLKWSRMEVDEMKITCTEYPTDQDWIACKERALVTVGLNIKSDLSLCLM